MDLKLSDVPNEALLQALADLEAAEKDDRYIIDMGTWHAPARWLGWLTTQGRETNKCYLCLAGSVLRARGGVGPQDDVLIESLPSPVQHKLRAIDHFRMGWLNQGMRHWFYEHWYDDDFIIPPLLEDYSVPDYDRDKDGFKAGVRAVAAELKAAGY